MSEAAEALTIQFLTWLDAHPRSYAETMDAWRTSCPRLSIWEDAVRDGFVEITTAPGRKMRDSTVRVTALGHLRLMPAAPAQPRPAAAAIAG